MHTGLYSSKRISQSVCSNSFFVSVSAVATRHLTSSFVACLKQNEKYLYLVAKITTDYGILLIHVCKFIYNLI